MPNFHYESIAQSSKKRTHFMIFASTLLAAAATQPSLAFVARFYKTGAAKSKFELYVSEMTGKNRKLLKTTDEPGSVQWIGHDRLAWFGDKGLWTSKLSPWNPILVKKTTTLHFEQSRYRKTEPGMPEMVEDFDRSKGVFILDPKSLKLEPVMETPHHEDINIPDEDSVSIPDPSNPDHPVKAKRFDGFTFWSNGKEETSEWDIFRAWNSDGGSKLWLGTGSHSSSSGDINGLMLFEKGKKPRTIFENANCADFWPSRSRFAYCTSRETSTLGKKEVWTSEMHVGDWIKGTDKTLLKGLVWVPSVSIRP
jgi:hypothetical protein